MAGEPSGTGFELVPIAIGRYDRPDFGELAVDREVEVLTELFAPFGAEVIGWDVPMEERSANAARTRLRDWSEGPGEAPSVLYWVGHGNCGSAVCGLACTDSVKGEPETGVSASALTGFLESRQAREDPPWCIVIVDACRAQELAAQLNRGLTGGEAKNLLVIGPATPGATTLGEVGRALGSIFGTVFGASHEIKLFDLLRSFRVDTERSQLTTFEVGLLDKAKLVRARFVPLAVSLEQRPGFESALTVMSEADRQAFARRVDLAEMAWQFVGRTSERERVVEWTESSEPMLVVTGPPGTGKSAFLGEVFVRSWPKVREELAARSAIGPLGPTETPPGEAFGGPIRVAGQTTVSTMRLVGEALGWTCAPDASPSAQMDALLEASRSAHALLIVDGVDEARQPLGVARLLRAVAEQGSRLLIGTRPSTKATPDDVQVGDADILDALIGSDQGWVLPLGHDAEALRDFVDSHFDGTPYDIDKDALRRRKAHICRVIKEEGAEFLRVRLVLREVAVNPSLLDVKREEELDALLRMSHAEVFAHLVARLSALSPSYRPILEALALSQGRGIPVQNGVLASVATELAEGSLPEPIGVAEITALFGVAAAYVVSETEHGQTVYRLAHKVFSDHFADDEARHAIVARALLANAGNAPSPYVVHYLSRHVARGGAASWADLAARPGLLDAIDPHALTADAQTIGLSALPRDIVATISVQDLIAASAADESLWTGDVAQTRRFRGGLRQLGAERLRPTPDAAPAAPSQTGWSVRWGKLKRKPPHLFATRGSCPVLALACAANNGKPIIAALLADRTIRLWDTTSGSALGPPLTLDGDGQVQQGALAIVEPLDEGPQLIVGVGAQVTSWDLVTGVKRTSFEVDEGVTTLAAYVDEGAIDGPAAVHVVTGGVSGRVALWTAAGERAELEGFEHATRPLRALVFTRLGGQWRLLVGGDDEYVRSYLVSSDGDLVRQEPEPECHALDEWVRDIAVYDEHHELRAVVVGDEPSVAIWEVDGHGRETLDIPGMGRSVATYVAHRGRQIAVGGADGKLYVLSADRVGADVQVVDAHADAVQALTTYELGGTIRVVSGAADGAVMIWEPDIETSVGVTTTPPAACRIAACVGPDDVEALAVGSEDGSVRLFDVASGADVTPGFLEQTLGSKVTALRSLADGRLAVAHHDGQLRVWDLASGTLRGSLPHSRAVRAITVVKVDDGDLLVTATEHGSVRFWDLDALEERAAPQREGETCVRALVQTGDSLLVVGGRDPEVLPLAADAAPCPALGGSENWLTTACQLGGGIAAGDDDGMIYVWERDRPEAPRMLIGHDGAVTALAPCEAAGWMVSGSRDGTVRLWDIADGSLLDVLRLGMPVNDLEVLPGASVAIATDEGTVVIDLAPLAAWAAEASGEAAALAT